MNSQPEYFGMTAMEFLSQCIQAPQVNPETIYIAPERYGVCGKDRLSVMLDKAALVIKVQKRGKAFMLNAMLEEWDWQELIRQLY
jgi:hypothetical protein